MSNTPPETILSKCCVSVILHYRVIPLSLDLQTPFYPTVTCGVPACDVFEWTSWFSSLIYSDIANRSRARGILTWWRDPISIRSRFSIGDEKVFSFFFFSSHRYRILILNMFVCHTHWREFSIKSSKFTLWLPSGYFKEELKGEKLWKWSLN